MRFCLSVMALMVSALILGPVAILQGADQAFVGVLALAVEDDVAVQLRLSDETKKKLLDLIDRRENEALEIALTLKDLAPAERAAKLAPFVAESERLGMEFLSPPQRTALRNLRINRLGLASLGEASVAEQLKLTDEQKKQIEQLLIRRSTEAAGGTEQERRLVTAKIEREMAGLLSKDQRATWEKLAGISVEDASKDEGTAEKPMAEPHKIADSPASKPATKPSEQEPADSGVPSADRKIRFKFRAAPWKDVLDWFAEQADLSLAGDFPPLGTLNYSDPRAFSPAEAIDLMNGYLLVKGYVLIRRERMLMLINLEDEIPEPLIDVVAPDELEQRGKYEVVKCFFPLKKMTPEDAERELQRLMGPLGRVTVLPQARQIVVRETAGKLRAIRDLIDSVENPDARREKDEKITVINLDHIGTEEFLVAARPLLSIPENLFAAPDGSLRISPDALNSRLLVAGKIERVQRVEEIRKLLDVDPGVRGNGEPIEQPQLEVYSVAGADPAAVLQVMQTLLAGLPDVRLTTDPKTGNLIAQARPSQQRTIIETLKQMQKDASEVDVIQLRRVDPQTAVVAINKLFGGDEKGAGINAPKVEGDVTSRQLYLRGTPSQVAQVRKLLEKMGESLETVATTSEEKGNVRVIPLTGRAARSTLDQLELLWPTVRANRIRVVTPSATAPAMKGRLDGAKPATDSPIPNQSKESTESKPTSSPTKVPLDSDPAASNRRSVFQFVSDPGDAPADKIAAPAKPAKKEKGDPKTLPEIIVSLGPNGIMIASEDTEALDEFESLLRMISDQAASGGKEFTVFYLRFAKAETAAALLQEVLNGGSSDTGGGGGGSLMGDIASSMMGDMGGGLLGSLLGGGGGGGASKILSSGSISIIPDSRLNALIVQASTTELDMIDELLKVIDQEGSPENVETAGRPRFIPLYNISADEAANVVRQAFAGRLANDPAAGAAQRQPSPEDLIKALRGGGKRDSKAEARGEQAKMTLAVDTRTNSLIITAPEQLYLEVKKFVETLDHAEPNQEQATRVVTVRKASPDLIQRALKSMVGESMKSNTTGSRPGGPGAGGPGSPPAAEATIAAPPGMEQMLEFRRRMEAFNGGQGVPGGSGGSRSGRGGGR